MKQMKILLTLPLYILHVLSLNLEQETGNPVEGFCFLPTPPWPNLRQDP